MKNLKSQNLTDHFDLNKALAETVGKFAYYAFVAKGKTKPTNPFLDKSEKNAFEFGYQTAFLDQTRLYLKMSEENLANIFNIDSAIVTKLNSSSKKFKFK